MSARTTRRTVLKSVASSVIVGQFASAAGGGDSSDALLLYSNDFATDRSADFTNGSATWAHQSGTSYADRSPNEGNYQYAAVDGAMVLGAAVSGNADGLIRIPCTEGQAADIYMLLNLPGASTVCDISYRYVSSIFTVLQETLHQNETGIIERTFGAAPANTAFFEISFLKKGVNTGGLEIFALESRDMAGRVAPTFTGKLPYHLAQKMYLNEQRTWDFSAAFDNATGVIFEDSEPHSTDGLSLTLTADTVIGTYAGAETQHAYEKRVYGENNGVRTRTPLSLPLIVHDPAALAIRTDHIRPQDTVAEVNRHFVWDTISYVTGGAWPYTCTVTAKPSWAAEIGNGVLEFTAPATPQAAQDVTVRVTDSKGDFVDVTRSVTVIAEVQADGSPFADFAMRDDSGSPHAGGTEGAPVNLRTLAGTLEDKPIIVRLGSGVFEFGNWYGILRDPDKTIYFLTPSDGSAIIKDAISFNVACGFSFGPVKVKAYTKPADNLSERQRALVRSQGVVPGGFWIRSQNWFRDLVIEGFEDDISNATESQNWIWRIRTDSGHVGEPIYSYAPTTDTRPEWISANLPTDGTEYGVAYYGGGIDLHWPASVEGLTLDKVTVGLGDSTQSSYYSGIRSNTGVRTDFRRVQAGAFGSVIRDLRTTPKSHAGNHYSSEHTDLDQGVQSGTSTQCSKRVFTFDGAFIGTREGIQGVQQNTQISNDGVNNLRDPENAYEDLEWHSCLMLGDLTNIVRATFGNLLFDTCLIGGAPDTTTDLQNGITAIRAVTASRVVLRNTLYVRINNEGQVDVALENCDTIANAIAGGAFPNVNNGALTYLDPRDAVENGAAANTARLWLDPDSAWGLANPTIGPAWLRDGVMS